MIGAAGRAAGSPRTGGALSEAEFRLFQGLIHRQSGIFLGDGKRELLVSRLGRRIKELGLSGFGDYWTRVLADAGEQVRMLDCVCTNETSFFREPAHFALLESRVFPEWREQARRGQRSRRVNAWSAACSTGEEPYSLAMALAAGLPVEEGWQVSVLATDLSTRVLAAARAATFPLARAAQIPPGLLKRFMLRGTAGHEGLMKAGPELRSRVDFARVNLAEERWPVHGRFDLLFCRNVLIYFTPQDRLAVVRRLLDRLAPGGFLFLGHAETLSFAPFDLRCVMPTVYRAPPAPARQAL